MVVYEDESGGNRCWLDGGILYQPTVCDRNKRRDRERCGFYTLELKFLG